MRLGQIQRLGDYQSTWDHWLHLAWESPECFLPKEQSTMCHTHQTLPVLVHVCHDNSDASSHSDSVQSCLHHVCQPQV